MNFADGGVHDITTSMPTMDISIGDGPGGVPTTVRLQTGGVVRAVFLNGSSVYEQNDGDSRIVSAGGTSFSVVRGGTIQFGFSLASDARAEVRGGVVTGDLVAADTSEILVIGDSFELEIGIEMYSALGFGLLPGVSDRFRGTLEFGDAIEIDYLHQDNFLTDGSVFLPEPSAGLSGLVALAAMLGLKRRTRD